MFSTNPFAELSMSISPSAMQAYIVVMIFLVAAGTIYDVLHKKSARYFRENMRKSKVRATQKVGGGEWFEKQLAGPCRRNCNVWQRRRTVPQLLISARNKTQCPHSFT